MPGIAGALRLGPVLALEDGGGGGAPDGVADREPPPGTGGALRFGPVLALADGARGGAEPGVE